MHSFFAAIPHHGPEYFGKLIIGLLIVLAILGLLHAAPKQSRRAIIAVFTFLGGLFYFLEFFLPVDPKTNKNFLTGQQEFVAQLSAVIGAYAIGLGVVSLGQYHAKIISRKREGWGNSVVLVIAALIMFTFSILNEYHAKTVLFTDPFQHHTQDIHGVFLVLFEGGLAKLDAATFALIAFFIASASYRAFRIRSVESSLLMIAALIVMLASTTIGTALTNWLPTEGPQANFRIEHISEWLLTRLNSPAQRGIVFGLEVGALATSLRLWLSLERGAYFDAEV